MTAPEPARDVDRALVEQAEKALGCEQTLMLDGLFCAQHREGHTDLGCPVAVATARFAQEQTAHAEAERDRARSVAVKLEQELDAILSGRMCGCSARAQANGDRFGCWCDCADYADVGYAGCEHPR